MTEPSPSTSEIEASRPGSEHPAWASSCEGLGFLGVQLDPAKNAAHPRDSDIAEASSGARVLVIHTREDLMIAREVLRLVPEA